MCEILLQTDTSSLSENIQNLKQINPTKEYMNIDELSVREPETHTTTLQIFDEWQQSALLRCSQKAAKRYGELVLALKI